MSCRFYVPPLRVAAGFLAVVHDDAVWARIMHHDGERWHTLASVKHFGSTVVRRSDTHLLFLDVVVNLVTLEVGSLNDDRHAFDFYWTLHAPLEITEAPVIPVEPMKPVPS